jgi:hypothetical protein
MTLARGERVSAVATLSPPASLSSCRTSGHWFRTIQHFFPLLCQSGATRQRSTYPSISPSSYCSVDPQSASIRVRSNKTTPSSPNPHRICHLSHESIAAKESGGTMTNPIPRMFCDHHRASHYSSRSTIFTTNAISNHDLVRLEPKLPTMDSDIVASFGLLFNFPQIVNVEKVH